MELYAKPLPGKVAQMIDELMEDEPVATARLQKICGRKMLLEKMEQMENHIKELQQSASQGYSLSIGQWRTGSTGTRNCWNCGEGHLSRECPSSKTTHQQGNKNRPML